MCGEACIAMGGVKGDGCGDDGDGEEPELGGRALTKTDLWGEPTEDFHAQHTRESARRTEEGEGGGRYVLDVEVRGEDDVVRGKDGKVE